MNVGHGRTDFTLILDDDMTIGYGIRLFYKGLHPQAQTMDIIGYYLTVNNDTFKLNKFYCNFITKFDNNSKE